MTATFSHLDAQGSAKMVDISAKAEQRRTATAAGRLACAASTIQALKEKALPKGDALTVARIAAIQAVKATSQLIPMCHPLPVDHVEVDFEVAEEEVRLLCTVRTRAATGVEMEALVGVSVAALTLYDMMKAVDKGMWIEGVHVVKKEKG